MRFRQSACAGPLTLQLKNPGRCGSGVQPWLMPCTRSMGQDVVPAVIAHTWPVVDVIEAVTVKGCAAGNAAAAGHMPFARTSAVWNWKFTLVAVGSEVL